jgi:hypothetical protein
MNKISKENSSRSVVAYDAAMKALREGKKIIQCVHCGSRNSVPEELPWADIDCIRCGNSNWKVVT